MSKLFLTGDRKVAEPYVPIVAVEMLRAVAQGRKIVTSDNHGVDALVRAFGENAGVEVEVITTPRDAEGHRDYPALFASLEGFEDVALVHVEPQSSRLVKAALALDDDATRLVGIESLAPH